MSPPSVPFDSCSRRWIDEPKVKGSSQNTTEIWKKKWAMEDARRSKFSYVNKCLHVNYLLWIWFDEAVLYWSVLINVILVIIVLCIRLIVMRKIKDNVCVLVGVHCEVHGDLYVDHDHACVLRTHRMILSSPAALQGLAICRALSGTKFHEAVVSSRSVFVNVAVSPKINKRQYKQVIVW